MAGALAVGTAAAQPEGRPDQQFAAKAYSIDQAEITLGHEAQKKGTTPRVKSLGETMVRDHTQAQGELEAAARQANIALPGGILPPQQQVADQLSGLSGKAFDDAYAKHMVAGHGAAIDTYAQEIADGKAPAMRAYAEKTLPTLESHERAATEADDSLRQHP